MTLNELLTKIYDASAKTYIGDCEVKVIMKNKSVKTINVFYNKIEQSLFIQIEE